MFWGTLVASSAEWVVFTIIKHDCKGDSGGNCNTLGNDSMCDSAQKSSYEHGSNFEQLPSYGEKKMRTILRSQSNYVIKNWHRMHAGTHHCVTDLQFTKPLLFDVWHIWKKISKMPPPTSMNLRTRCRVLRVKCRSSWRRAMLMRPTRSARVSTLLLYTPFQPSP